MLYPGADPGILVRGGGVDFFFQRQGSGGRYTLSKRRNAPLSTNCHQKIFPSLIYLFIIELWFESIYSYFLDLNPHYTHRYSHHVLRTLSQQMFLVFFHEIIEANYKLMRNFGEKKINQSFIEQFSEKYSSIILV